jgi:TolB protein
LGVLDYHEVVSWVSWAGYDVWHHALNNGFRIPAVGGEDAISNLHNNRIVGQTRTYAYMPDGLSWQGWIDAIKKANMFVTNGPLLKLDIEGKMPGDEIELPESGGKVTLKGMVQSIVRLDHVELVINGQKTSLDDFKKQFDEPNRPGVHFEFEKEIEINNSCWITLQAYARRRVHPIDDRFPQATTNPIWIMVGDQPVRSAGSADYFIRWIDKLTQMSEAHPGWRSEKEKAHVLDQHQQAKTVYQRLLNQARELENIYHR